MVQNVSKEEIGGRLLRFFSAMDAACPDWDTAVVLSKVNQYYFTGTMQDGMLVIKRDRRAFYFVRRSFERAKEESPFSDIYPMESYRDAAGLAGADFGNTYIETEIVPVGIIERLKKVFCHGKSRFARPGHPESSGGQIPL